MIAKVTKVIKKDKDDNGNPLLDKNKNPYLKVAIKIEGNDNWLSTIIRSDKNREWFMEEGKEYSISISERSSEGKTFYNFRLLSASEQKDIELEGRIEALERAVFKAGNNTAPAAPTPTETEEDLNKF